jgi:hypothetical protein
MGIMGTITCLFCNTKNGHEDEVPLECSGCGAIFHGFDDGGWEKGEFQKWAEKEWPGEKYKGMKLYLASSFDNTLYVKRLAKGLEEKGYKIMVDWWNQDFKLLNMFDMEWYNFHLIKEKYEIDTEGIDKSDALIIVGPMKGYQKFNGANIELGYALGKGKPVFSIGNLERSIMYYPVIKCRNLEELEIELNKINTKLNERLLSTYECSLYSN